MTAKTSDDLTARRKQLELQREDRALRQKQDLDQFQASIAVITAAATGALMGIQQVRESNIDLAAKRGVAFAKTYATMVDAGLPKAAAFDATSKVFGLSSDLNNVVNDAAGELAEETRYLRQRMADVESEAAALKNAMETENTRRATIAASFEGDDEALADAVKHG
jgi:hypothetical protein